MAIDTGPFNEFMPVDHLLKGRLFDKKILPSVFFARPRFSGRVGDGMPQARNVGGQLLAKGSFAGAGWCGDDKQNASPLRRRTDRSGRGLSGASAGRGGHSTF